MSKQNNAVYHPNKVEESSSIHIKKQTQRLFFAVMFPAGEKNRLAQLRDHLARSGKKGSYTSTSNFHLTIRYLGEGYSLDALLEHMKNIKGQPFPLTFDHIGFFPKRSGDVVYVAMNETCSEVTALQSLYHGVTELVNAGNKMHENTKPLAASTYTPHITLGRKVRLDDKFIIQEMNQELHQHPIVFQVDQLHLMQSHRVDGALTYTSLGHICF